MGVSDGGLANRLYSTAKGTMADVCMRVRMRADGVQILISSVPTMVLALRAAPGGNYSSRHLLLSAAGGLEDHSAALDPTQVDVMVSFGLHLAGGPGR